MDKTSSKFWIWSLILSIPVFLVYCGHFYHSIGDPSQSATGFIIYDMAYYLSNAREYFDSDSLHFFYSNPFSDQYDSASIYFQPQILLMALLWKISGCSPGYVFCFYGFLMCLLAFRVSIGLYGKLVGFGSGPRRFGLILFSWGGGVLALFGFCVYFLKSRNVMSSLQRMHDFDPHYGYWFLNLGRNFIFPNEAYYHVLFLGTILLILKERLPIALGLTALLSMSHPFTGLALVVVIIVWVFFEKFYVRQKEIPNYFLFVNIGILIGHFSYYIGYLPMNSEHALLMDHWALDWSMKAINFIPAYILVALFFFWQIKSPKDFATYFSQWENRLLLVWFVVIFLLANHEFAFKAHQPLHFTRGYIWTALFLLGRKTFIEFLEYLWTKGRWPLLFVFSLVFLSDNITWMARQTWSQSVGNLGFHLTTDQQAILNEMNKPVYHKNLLLSEDQYVSYMATIYSPLRTWYSHDHNTPNVEEKREDIQRFFTDCKPLSPWNKRDLLILIKKPTKSDCFLDQQAVFENKTYAIYHNKK